jgi:hypothetical protein
MPSDWTKTADGQYWEAQGKLLLPVDPSGIAIVMLRSLNGIGAGFSAVEKGDPGVHAEIDEAINFTALAPDSPTPDSASWTVITPPTTATPGKWKLNLALHKGLKGDDGESVWDPTDLSESPVGGQIPAVNPAGNGFELVAQKITEVFYPSLINTGSSNGTFKLTEIPIPARPWARRLRGHGFTVVTGDTADMRVNLLARLGGAGGNIIGRCVGVAQTERLTLSPGKPNEIATAADSYDTIAANTSTVVHIQCERAGGSASYTPSASMSQFNIEALPL